MDTFNNFTSRFLAYRIIIVDLSNMSLYETKCNWDDTISLNYKPTGQRLFYLYEELPVVPQAFGFSISHNASPESLKAIENLTDACNKLSGIFEQPGISNIPSVAREGSLQFFKKVIPLFVGALFIYNAKYNKKPELVSYLALALSTYNLFDSNVQKNKLNMFVSKMVDNHPQGDFYFEDLSDTLLSFLLMIVSGKEKHKSFSKRILESIVGFGKNRKPFRESLDLLITKIRDILEYFGFDYMLDIFSSNDYQIHERFPRWSSRVRELSRLNQKGDLAITRENFNLLHSLQMEALDIVASVRDKDLLVRTRTVFEPHIQVLRRMLNVFEQASFGKNQFRIEPLTIMLTGQPGVGKSMMTVPLVNDILCRVLPKEVVHTLADNPMDHIYMRKNEHKYWDGYHGQFATVFDDFGQSRDFIQNLESEYMDLIRVCNAFPHICHMASLENKGNVEFKSDLILLTSNMLRLQIHSIVQPEAVLRRFDICVLVVPKKEYCLVGTDSPDVLKRRLDNTLIKTEFDDNIYEFYKYNMDNGEVLGNPMGYKQLEDMLVQSYQRKFNKGAQMQDVVKRRITDKVKNLPQGAFDQEEPLQDPFVAHEFGRFLSTMGSRFEEKIKELKMNGWFKFKQMNTDIVDQWNSFLRARSSLGGTVGTEIERWYLEFTEKIKPVLTVRNAFSLLSMALAVTGIFSYFRPMSSSSDSQAASGQEPKQKQGMSRIRERLVHPTYRSQLGNPVAGQKARTILRHSFYELIRASDYKLMGFVLIIDENYMLYPKHYYNRYKIIQEHGNPLYDEGFILNNDFINKSYAVTLPEMMDVIEDDKLSSLDVILCRYPEHMHRHRDIKSHFASVHELKGLDRVKVRFATSEDSQTLCALTDATKQTRIKVSDSKLPDYTILSGYKYNLATQDGDCGSLLISDHPGSTRGKILGMHVAGNGMSIGFSAAITAEDLQNVVDLHPQMNEDFKELGVAPKPVHAPRSSTIVPSPLYDTYIKPITKPAKLRPVEDKDPMTIAISKYAYVPIKLDGNFLLEIKSCFNNLYNTDRKSVV